MSTVRVGKAMAVLLGELINTKRMRLLKINKSVVSVEAHEYLSVFRLSLSSVLPLGPSCLFHLSAQALLVIPSVPK
jgi:hypothetical protein